MLFVETCSIVFVFEIQVSLQFYPPTAIHTTVPTDRFYKEVTHITLAHVEQ